MPIYEYECDACGHHTEALQKFSDPPLTECEECHSSKLKKLISHSTFHLKGTGWYVTDYASKSSTPSSSGKEKASDEGKKSETASSTDSQQKKAASATSSAKD